MVDDYGAKTIFNDQAAIFNKFTMTQANNYNLQERTAVFGEAIIKFCKTLELNAVSRPIISQIISSGTSIGANYAEANNASSRKDFQNKIFISKKESQETKHWLRMLATCFPNRNGDIKVLWREAQDLTMIFQKITNSLKGKKVLIDSFNEN